MGGLVAVFLATVLGGVPLLLVLCLVVVLARGVVVAFARYGVVLGFDVLFLGNVFFLGVVVRAGLSVLVAPVVVSVLVFVASVVVSSALSAFAALSAAAVALRRLVELDVFRAFSASLGQSHLVDHLFQESLNLLEPVHVLLVDEGDGHAVAVGSCGTADAVHVVLGVVGHVVVDYHLDVVDVDAACHDVGGHEHVELSALELEHHVVALCLLQVAVHGTALDASLLEGSRQLLHLHLAAAEHDDAVQVAGLEDVLDDGHLLGFVAYVSLLLDFLCGLAHGELDGDGVLEQRLGQLLYLVGHGGGEHDGLASLGQLRCDGLDVFRESHVEHAVGLVEDEEAHPAQVYVAQRDMGDEASGCGYHHVGSHAQALELLVVAVAVVAAVYSHAAHALQIVAEALHGLVYLLCQLACGRHDDAVDGIGGVASVVDLAQYGQQVGGGLAGAGLCHAEHVVSVQYLRDTLFLYGSASVEAHVVQCVEHVVI